MSRVQTTTPVEAQNRTSVLDDPATRAWARIALMTPQGRSLLVYDQDSQGLDGVLPSMFTRTLADLRNDGRLPVDVMAEHVCALVERAAMMGITPDSYAAQTPPVSTPDACAPRKTRPVNSMPGVCTALAFDVADLEKIERGIEAQEVTLDLHVEQGEDDPVLEGAIASLRTLREALSGIIEQIRANVSAAAETAAA